MGEFKPLQRGTRFGWAKTIQHAAAYDDGHPSDKVPAMPFPNDPKLRGLAAAMFHSDIPPWEYDIRAVPPGTEPLRVSDWYRRHGRANNASGSMERAAEARIQPLTQVPERD